MNELANSRAWYQSSCDVGSSLWGRTANDLPDLQAVKDDLRTDVLVIGAGFCGQGVAIALTWKRIMDTVRP